MTTVMAHYFLAQNITMTGVYLDAWYNHGNNSNHGNHGGVFCQIAQKDCKMTGTYMDAW